jgi:predicted AAA+ superfamily ATPase
LGGRARFLRFHPFTYIELKGHFSLEKVVNIGLIPGIYFSDDPEKDLDAYLATYVQQEIANEGLVRNLTTFTRFLEVAALCNAEQIDYTSVSNDAQIARTTIHEYFKILEDTLIGYLLPAWKKSKKRKPIATSKFYFFDWAIPRKLQEISGITPKSEIFGKAFESYMFHEIKTYCDYHGIKDLHYWRTKDQSEVDFIIDNKIAVEVKGSKVFNSDYLNSLNKLREEKIIKEFYLVYLGNDLILEEYPWVKVMNYQNFLTKIYQMSGNKL